MGFKTFNLAQFPLPNRTGFQYVISNPYICYMDKSVKEQIRESVRNTIQHGDELIWHLSRPDVLVRLNIIGYSQKPNFTRSEVTFDKEKDIEVIWDRNMERHKFKDAFEVSGSYPLVKGLEAEIIDKTFKMQFTGYISGSDYGMIKYEPFNEPYKILQVIK